MASSNESNQESGTKQTDRRDSGNGPKDRRSTDLETRNEQPELFSSEDEFRSPRTDALHSEASELLDQVQARATGIEGCTPEQLRNIHADARERERWSETRKDGFVGILRLGRKSPPRSKRIL